MWPLINSLIVLAALIILARLIKRHSGLLQKYFIPSSLVAGILGLVFGPQLLGFIPADITSYWGQMPKYLISIVFAGLFLGRFIPSLKKIWSAAGPMVAFGNTLAWGQYVLGIALTMLILTPVFGANPMAGALIEISFEGGHGTAAGLAPTFEQLGWPEGTDIALGIATFSILAALLSGIIMLNIYNRRRGVSMDKELFEIQKKEMIRSGYDLASLSKRFELRPKDFLVNILAFALAISIGWFILEGLVYSESALLASHTDLRFFAYVPLFPLAMIGGLILQLILKKYRRQNLINRKTASNFGSIALDLLIASAIATVSLSVISDNWPIFLILSVAGVVWILACFLLLSPLMFKKHWFEYGLTNTGQSMGMTATGLLLNRLVDPGNKTKAREGFAYKQLIFEPFMGGGLITAVSAIMIHEFGSLLALIVSSVLFAFWLGLGILLPKITK